MPQEPRLKSSKTGDHGRRVSSIEPSSRFLEDFLGSDKFSPQIQEGIRIAKQENPNLAPVKPYGFFSRLVAPETYGIVGGFDPNSIHLSGRYNATRYPQNIADTLTHEQTHINQVKSGTKPQGLLSSLVNPPQPYHRNPLEMEAFHAERDRQLRTGREPWLPSFATGEYFSPRDVNLPYEKPFMKRREQTAYERRDPGHMDDEFKFNNGEGTSMGRVLQGVPKRKPIS